MLPFAAAMSQKPRARTKEPRPIPPLAVFLIPDGSRVRERGEEKAVDIVGLWLIYARFMLDLQSI